MPGSRGGAWESPPLIFKGMGLKNCYRKDPKISDRHVWANSADPDQTAPRREV